MKRKPSKKMPIPVQKKAAGGAVDGMRQHAAMAMGKKVTGMKKGGGVC